MGYFSKIRNIELIPTGTENMNKYFQISFLIKESISADKMIKKKWGRWELFKYMAQEKNNC